MAQKPIQAAGGIVVRGGARPLVAVVQRSKDERWVLPRGKLKRDENPRTGARREVVEETGHRVRVREFLGAITYTVRGQPKVVQFWHMQAEAQPSRDVMKDIAAVEWLPLAAAVRRLSFSLEKLFLRNVGQRALKRRKRGVRRKAAKARARPRAHAAKAKPRRPRPAHSMRAGKAKSHLRKSRTPARRPAGRATMLQRMLGRLTR